jgi:hypothetical protein
MITVSIPVPSSTGPSGAWVASAITKITNVVPEGAAVGDAFQVYGSADGTGTTADTNAELVATVVVSSKATTITLNQLVANQPGAAFQFYAVTLSAGTGGGGKQVVVSGVDETGGGGGVTVTANQGAPAPLDGAWPVLVTDGVHGPAAVKAASTTATATDPAAVVALSPNSPLPAGTNAIGHVVIDGTVPISGSVSAAQGTSPWVVSGTVASTQITTPWVTAFSAPQPVTQSGAWSVGQSGAPWSVAFPSPQHVVVDSVASDVIVDQGTSPWVVSGTVAATQATSPWVISGAVTQGTSPWVTSFATPQHVVVDSVTGNVTVLQGTSPWVVSGTVSAAQSGAWTVSASQSGAWAVTANQGTSPWVTSFATPQHVVVDGGSVTVSGSVTANQGTSPWVVGGTVSATQSGVWTVTADQGTSPWVVSGTVTANQGTSPWVTSVSNFPATQAVTQGTSPWVTSFSAPQHVIVDSVTGHVTVDQGTSPWVISGTVASTQSGAWTVSAAQSGAWSVTSVQGTSPWVVSGTVAVTQSTSPWITSVSNFPATQAVTQSTSPWVVSGTVTANQGTPAAATSAWPVTTIAGTPVTYSASTSGTVSTGTTAGTVQSIAYLWHPSTSGKRVKILKIMLSWSGNGGNNTLSARGTFITPENATPGGATSAPQAHDQADAASALTFRVGATGAPTRVASDLFTEAMLGGSSDQQSVVFFDAQTVGKPLILRAGTNEGFEVRTVVGGSNLASAVQVAVYYTWTEE